MVQGAYLSETPNTQTKAQPAEADKALMSIEDLDQVLANEEPDFKSQIEEMSGEGASQDLNIELIDLDQLLAEQEARSFKFRIRRLNRKIRNFLTGLRTTAWHFLKDELPALLKAGVGQTKKGLGIMSEGLRQFGFKPMRFKLMVFGFIGICGLAAVGITYLAMKGLPEEENLFIQSLAEISQNSWEYDPKAEQEPLYDSVRAAQNIFEVPRLVVNLRPSINSGRNPMAAGALYVEGNSPDVVLELKDRETEFRDVFMRTIEEFSYDELDTMQGKQKLLERLAREANRLATKGRIRKVFFKTFIMKP
jgi:flagellar basal body-associated protein FliL